ncbi:MAG TPA: NHL repeat-containing protein, partial [Terrimicrobiaceae bacterium]|nr:NHL repeat-containing protein [Terrimicrobiaceae bacterium]
MRSSHERSFALVVFVILLASLGLGTALAQGEEGAGAGTSSAAVLLPPEANSLADLLASSSDGQQIEAEPAVDPVAAQNLPHSDLSRPEAEELLVEVFGGGLEGSAELLSELEVQAFRSDYVAVVPSPEPGADAGLLSSLLPLRAENEHGDKELIDLSLVAEGDHLEPSNPLVPIEIPSELSDGITFPDTGIVIDVASGETSRQASEVGDATAFFPNIRPDSDFVASAIPTGVETYTQLRSPEAPPTEIFDLTLPPGAELSEAAGGAQVVDSTGQVILSISAPSAIDAEERAIPVSIAVASGNRVVVSIDPPADTSYPVLVDPVFENYSWMNSNSNAGIGDWRSATQNQERLWPSWIGVWNQTMHAGLNLRSYAGSISPGSQANWNYYVPRYFSDFENPAVAERPTTFIRNMTLSQVYFLIEEGAPVHAHPYMLVGLWDGNKGQFASLGTRDGTQGQYNGVNIPLPNPGEYTNVKNGGIALATSESTTYPRQAFVGGAWVELSDNDSPASEEVGSVPEWLSTNAGAPIIYKFTDPGIGVHNVRLEYTRATGITATPITGLGCSGSVSNPCPRTVSKATKAIPYYPDLMAQGENWVKVIAQDAVSHFSNAGEVRIKVDRAKPELLTKGTLTEQAKVGTGLSEYGLSISATDGDEAEAAALTPHGAAGTGPGQLERPMGLAVDDTGNTWVTDRTNQRVIQYDAEGKLLREINAKGNADGQLNEPRGVAVAANGNIWVAEAGANKRVQQFSPTGTFVSKITNVNFVEPWGVALAPDGTVWITDLGAKKIFLYKSDGTFIRSFDSSQALSGGGLPVGLEVDEFGNAWIAFQGSDQVVAVSPNGEKVVSFGGTGTEPGKFKAPVDIAIAPSGNLLVSDDGNSRIQEFRPGGSFLRQFGAAGSASNQLKELRAIDLAPGNELRIADAGNKRVTRWSHADKHPESGVVKTEVKVDGVLKDLSNPGCTPKNCSISRSWTLDADDYPVGAHNVDVITTDGVGLQRKKSFAIETHGDLQAPAVTLSGTMTEQTTIGTTRPAYKLQVSATDPGSAAERKSGVISIVTMVDGALKDVGFQNCPSGGCSMTREWTLDSGKYSPGPHLVEVKATDGAGRSTAKLLNIQVDRDTTPPTLSLSGGLPTAPEGWVQQETKNATAIATDEKGYGVKQIRFSIDAVSVGQSAVQNCAAGACAASEIFAINMAAYNGGAHEAAMVAEDLAGNIRKKTWTINVDPEGHISAT